MLHSPYRLVQFWSSLKKFTCAYLFQIALEIMSLPILITMLLFFIMVIWPLRTRLTPTFCDLHVVENDQ